MTFFTTLRALNAKVKTKSTGPLKRQLQSSAEALWFEFEVRSG